MRPHMIAMRLNAAPRSDPRTHRAWFQDRPLKKPPPGVV